MDSLEQRKHLKRIEISNSILELTTITQYKYSKDSEKIIDRSGTLEKLFVILVTEVSLISRELNLRFERIFISRRFLWKSSRSFPFCTRHDCRRGLVPGYPKLANFGTCPLFDSVRHFITKHIPLESVNTSTIRFSTVHPQKRLFSIKNRFFFVHFCLQLCDDRREELEQGQPQRDSGTSAVFP